MDSILLAFKNLKKDLTNRSGSKSEKTQKSQKERELVSRFKGEIEALENRLMVPLTLIGYAYDTVIPRAMDARIDDPNLKLRLKALHMRHQLWIAVVRDQTKPWFIDVE